jgi:hypothetical protein
MLDVYQLLILSLHILAIISSQKLYQRLINKLGLSIGLRMECCGILQYGIHHFPKCYPKPAQKTVVLIRYDGGWQLEMYPDMTEK